MFLKGVGDNAWWVFWRLVGAVLVGPLVGWRAKGGENLPLSGGFVVAVTHKNAFDPVFAAMALRRPLRFMAKKELFRNPLLRRLIVSLGAFPIDRGAADREALRTSIDIVRRGEGLLMFPEGTRFPDDEVHPFHPGVAMIALRAEAPVVPVALRGSARLGDAIARRNPGVRVAVGRPVDLSGLEGRTSDRYAAACERIRAAVVELYDGL
jgi:1-acyl-sn-glycerol-3-phosphate acyltransferase